MIAPKGESRDLVLSWVEEAGLSRYASSYPSSDSVVLEASISQIEKLINAEYSSFGEYLLLLGLLRVMIAVILSYVYICGDSPARIKHFCYQNTRIQSPRCS
jgi:hypothetical protein